MNIFSYFVSYPLSANKHYISIFLLQPFQMHFTFSNKHILYFFMYSIFILEM